MMRRAAKTWGNVCARLLLTLAAATSLPATLGQEPAAPVLNDQAYVQFRNSLVLIFSRNRVGAGFFVGKDTILTAAHVVDRGITSAYWLAGGCLLKDPAIKEFPLACPLELETLTVRKSADIAILRAKRFDEDVPDLEMIGEDRVPVGARIGILGFPLRGRSGEVVADPILSTGIVASELRGTYEGKGAAQFYWVDAVSMRGFSGGPVFLLPDGEVIGVASAMNPTLDPSSVSFGYVSSIENIREDLKRLLRAPD